jgi:hypothetical protein
MGETAEPNKLTEQVDPKKINISDSQLKLLGITKPQYIDLLNKSLSATEKYKYGTYAQDLGTSGITGSNVATKQDYDRLAALEALLPQDINEKYISTPNQAGKYNSDITDFNYKGLLDFLKARQPIVPGTPLPAVDPSTTENPGIVNLPPMNVNSLTRRQRGVI